MLQGKCLEPFEYWQKRKGGQHVFDTNLAFRYKMHGL